MKDSLAEIGEFPENTRRSIAKQRSSALRAARRQNLKREMEEAVSGFPVSADSVPRGVASEDQIQANDDERAARPPGDLFQAFEAADLDRDHGNGQLERRKSDYGRRDSGYIGDISLGDDAEDDRKYCTLTKPAALKDISHFYFDYVDGEKINLDDAAPGGGLFGATTQYPLETIDFSNAERRAVKPLGAIGEEEQSLKKYTDVAVFNSSGKFSNYELQAKPIGATFRDDVSVLTHGDDAPYRIKHSRKKRCLAFALVISSGIAVAFALAIGKKKEAKNTKHTFTAHDLSAYGYPYTQETSSTGWVTWLPGRRYDGDDPNHVSYDASVGISTLEECAAICQKSKAPTASWSEKQKTCWCSFAALSNLCREPCVEEEYIDFATVPILDIQYCELSVCDKDWFLHDPEYCEVDVGFDQDACDAKKGEIDVRT